MSRRDWAWTWAWAGLFACNPLRSCFFHMFLTFPFCAGICQMIMYIALISSPTFIEYLNSVNNFNFFSLMHCMLLFRHGHCKFQSPGQSYNAMSIAVPTKSQSSVDKFEANKIVGYLIWFFFNRGQSDSMLTCDDITIRFSFQQNYLSLYQTDSYLWTI